MLLVYRADIDFGLSCKCQRRKGQTVCLTKMAEAVAKNGMFNCHVSSSRKIK